MNNTRIKICPHSTWRELCILSYSQDFTQVTVVSISHIFKDLESLYKYYNWNFLVKHQVHWLLENEARSRPKHEEHWVLVRIIHMETHCILLHSSETHWIRMNTTGLWRHTSQWQMVTWRKKLQETILWHFPAKQERINASGKNRRKTHLFLKFEAIGMVSQASPACLPAFVKSRGRRKTKWYKQEDDCTRWTVVCFSMHSDRKNM